MTNEYTAVFELNPAAIYQLFIATEGGGQVLQSPARNDYPCGTSVANLALPAKGWTFLGWVGDIEGTNSIAAFTVHSNTCAEAVFGATLMPATEGAGSVRLEPEGEVFAYGTEITATAVPEQGHYFERWTGLLNISVNPATFPLVSATTNLTAHFLPLETGYFTFDCMTHGRGRVEVEPHLPFYAAGSTVTNRAVPASGQEFLGWSGDTNGAIIAGDTLVITLDTNKLIHAQFTSRPAVISADCADSGEARVLITGNPGEKYVVERATALQAETPPATNGNWITIGTASNSLGRIYFTDSSGDERG